MMSSPCRFCPLFVFPWAPFRLFCKRARAAKRQTENHASPAVSLRYDSKWGDFQLLWSQFLTVSPSLDFGIAHLHCLVVGDIFLLY
jgi:hypothetical protein